MAGKVLDVIVKNVWSEKARTEIRDVKMSKSKNRETKMQKFEKRQCKGTCYKSSMAPSSHSQPHVADEGGLQTPGRQGTGW